MKQILKKNCIPLCFITWLSVITFPFEVHSAPVQVYSIQAGSLSVKEEALKQYNALEKAIPQHEEISLRVEYVEPYFTVRIGRFDNYTQTKELLGKIKSEIPGAIVVKCYFDSDRIVSPNDQLLQSEPKKIQDIAQISDRDFANQNQSTEAAKSEQSSPDIPLNRVSAKVGKSFSQLNFPGPAAGPPRNTHTTSKTFLLVALSLLGMFAYASYNKRKHSLVSKAEDPQLADYAKLVILRPRIVAHFTDNPPTCIGDVALKIKELSGYEFNQKLIKKFVKSLRTDF